MKCARGGFTLVEVMLAGAIAVLATLALMEGLVVAAKISQKLKSRGIDVGLTLTKEELKGALWTLLSKN